MTISKDKFWTPFNAAVVLGGCLGTIIGFMGILAGWHMPAMRSLPAPVIAQSQRYCPDLPMASAEGTGSASVQVYPERFRRRASITVIGSIPNGVDPSCVFVDVSGGGMGRPFEDTRVYLAGDGKFVAKCIRFVGSDAAPTINVSIRRAYEHCADVSAANIRFAVDFECD